PPSIQTGSHHGCSAAVSWNAAPNTSSAASSSSSRGSSTIASSSSSAAPAPLTPPAAASWARAAISGVGNVPSQMRDFFRGSLISDTHFPHARIRTPRYDGCLPPSPDLPLFSPPPPPLLPSTGDSGGDAPPDDAGLHTSSSGIAAKAKPRARAGA
ncbi:Os02g0230875, partial [Oryza sativa Japonica Group]